MAGDLSVLQAERDVWAARNFPSNEENMPNSLLGAVEEVGELTHHYLKLRQGIRGEAEMHKEEMADAVADCVIFLAGVCTYLGIDYGEIVQQTWDQVKTRDWITYPNDGRTH